MDALRILLFNLRDIRNPQAGGAEVFTHAVTKRWVSGGHEVTEVVSGFSEGKREETLDGVDVIRLGNPTTVFALAKRYYRARLMSRFDLVIDEYTLRPFLARDFAEEPVLFLAHELAREKFFYALPPVVSHAFYYLLEPRWLSRYQTCPTVTVSESTKRDLVGIGFEDVHIVPEGIEVEPLTEVPLKEKAPTLIYVGLLKRANIVGDAVQAFREISKSLPNARLWVVGDGNASSALRRKARGTNTTFFGYVPEEKKLELMRRAHVLLFPAVREGWGLVVTEANACGTPAVGYRVPGLIDSIRDESTGLLTDSDPWSLAQAALRLFQSPELRLKLAATGLRWSKEFSWGRTASEFLKVAEKIAGR